MFDIPNFLRALLHGGAVPLPGHPQHDHRDHLQRLLAARAHQNAARGLQLMPAPTLFCSSYSRIKPPPLSSRWPSCESDVSPALSKYIYLNDWGTSERERFVDTCRKNFLVYIVTVETDELDVDPDGGMHSARTINDAASLRQHHHHNRQQYKHNVDSNSEKSSSCRSKSRKYSHNKRDKQEPNSRIYKFIKRIMPLRNSRAKCATTTSSTDEVFIRDYSYNESSGYKAPLMDSAIKPYYVPPLRNFMDQPVYEECSVSDTLREINDLGTRIEQSEIAIREMIIKYLQDKVSETELVQAVSSHGKLLGDAEKRTNNMVNDHWMQEVESYKEQQKHLHVTMDSVIHQNRELLEDNEALMKQNEKLSAALLLNQQEDSSEPASQSKSTSLSSRCILEDLSKNNDRLRCRVSTMMTQLSDMEDNIKKFQKRNQFIQQQLNSSSAQLQNNKLAYDKSKADYELQIAKLSTQLQTNNNTMKECTDSARIILQDIEMLRMQLQPITKTMRWEKFERSDRTLPELMPLFRACINEVSSELVYKQNDLTRAQSEIDSLRQANSSIPRLKEEIEGLKDDLEKRVMAHKDCEREIQTLNADVTTRENKLTSITSLVSDKDHELGSKEKLIKEHEDDIKSLNEAITELQKELHQVQFASEKSRHENNALELQLKGMAEVLTATGAGDIAKELANTQEKLTVVQTQYFAIAAENNVMIKQIETNHSERQTLVAYQKNCYEQLQVLHKEIEVLEKANEQLKEQLDNEKQTVTALQTERVRHLEERTILTAIYERLKNEISKVDELEGAVSSMNKKASRLALIAEYNKQLGEKLQLEVAERDNAISELQNNVKQLNSFQMESTKEKAALCEELNKVFSVKEVLNTKLAAELEKNVILDETKREIQNSATLQLREIQEAYNREHAALKSLVNDVKQLVAERDALLDAKKEHEKKCLNMIIEQDKWVEIVQNLQNALKTKEKQLGELEEQLMQRSNDLDSLKKSSESDINFLRNKFEMVSNQMEGLAKEKEAMKGSLEYMQSDLSKTRNDLDIARQREHEAKMIAEELQMRVDRLLEEYHLKTSALHEIIMENEELKINVYSLGEKFKCLAEENERITQDSARMESMMAEKFQTTKLSGLPTPKHVENVLDDINARDEEILILQDRIREYEERGEELNDLLRTVSDNRNELEGKNKELKQELERTLADLRSAKRKGDEVEGFVNELQERYVPIEHLEEEQMRYNSTIDNIKSDYDDKLKLLIHEVDVLEAQKKQQVAQTSESLLNLQQYKDAHEKLQKAHKLLALKLFTAVRVLICEKVSLENLQSKVRVIEMEKQDIQQQKERQEEEILKYRSQIESLNTQLAVISEENKNIVADVQSARDYIKQLEGAAVAAGDSHNAHELQELVSNQERHIASIKSQLEESRRAGDELRRIVVELESSCACMEFERSETELRLHELQSRSQAEISRNDEMKRMLQATLSHVIDMKEKGLITAYVHQDLMKMFSEHMTTAGDNDSDNE